MPAIRHERLTARSLYTRRPMQVRHTADTYDLATDVDWIAVERAAEGTYDPTLLNLAERRQAVLLMLDHGHGAPTISVRLSTHERTIQRWGKRRATVDFTRVEKALAGEYAPSRLSRAELREAVLLMLDQCHTEREITTRLGVDGWEIRHWDRQEKRNRRNTGASVLHLPDTAPHTTTEPHLQAA